MAKKPADEQKRAKNLKQAHVNAWLGFILFSMALFMLFVEVGFWKSDPTASHGLGLLSICGMVLAGAFLRADAKETIRRGGEKYESVGGQISILLAITCRAFEEGFPLFYLPWLLGVCAALTLGGVVWLTLRLRYLRRTKASTV